MHLYSCNRFLCLYVQVMIANASNALLADMRRYVHTPINISFLQLVQQFVLQSGRATAHSAAFLSIHRADSHVGLNHFDMRMSTGLCRIMNGKHEKCIWNCFLALQADVRSHWEVLHNARPFQVAKMYFDTEHSVLALWTPSRIVDCCLQALTL